MPLIYSKPNKQWNLVEGINGFQQNGRNKTNLDEGNGME